ncbi:RTG3 [[Candida] subhashii]|uniref:RTG3 n=1 Tax=[Candida] subhashii TaxID=561895 RepID=A0A8J5V045_9ASCO|nr:RTG3 [[Candida] subhashii]KAG7665240.1 RTG3 [[Candida] subhashii]
MDDYLKDSPSDYSTTNIPSNTASPPNYKYINTSYDTSSTASQPQQQQQQQQQQQSNPYNYSFDTITSNNNTTHDFSLNLNYSGFNNNNNTNNTTDNTSMANTNNNSAFNSNTQLASGDYLSPTGFSFNPGSDTNTYAGSDPSSLPNEEQFLDDVDTIGFSHTVLGPQLQAGRPQSASPQLPLSPQQQYTGTSNTLDEIMSPPNNGYDNSTTTSTFLNPQYFSPPTRGGGYNPLNSIAEGELASSFNDNTFSPQYSRKGSISGYNPQPNAPDLLSGSYLSPQYNPPYTSPPNYNNDTYLNSPPQSHSQYLPRINMSSSIPVKAEYWNALSPPPQQAILSSSVPSSSTGGVPTSPSGISRESVPTKQLSKEEKLKRRREFHNAVERRRRDLIKERIKELGVIVPPSLLNPQLCAVQTLQRKSGSGNMNAGDLTDLINNIKVKETKPNKSTILNRAVDYIEHLNYVLNQQDKTRSELQARIEMLEKDLNDPTASSSSAGGGIDQVAYDEYTTLTTTSGGGGGGDYSQYQSSSSSQQPIFGTQYSTEGIKSERDYNPDEFFVDIVNTGNQ